MKIARKSREYKFAALMSKRTIPNTEVLRVKNKKDKRKFLEGVSKKNMRRYSWRGKPVMVYQVISRPIWGELLNENQST